MFYTQNFVYAMPQPLLGRQAAPTSYSGKFSMQLLLKIGKYFMKSAEIFYNIGEL
jgi:hypothetical protein